MLKCLNAFKVNIISGKIYFQIHLMWRDLKNKRQKLNFFHEES